MKYRTSLLIILLAGFISLAAQGRKEPFTVMFYNVENLFDTLDAPDFEDEAFTPSGYKEWDYDRYEKKLTDVARVILSLPEKGLPALIGFSEVENAQVLEDLAAVRGLRRGDYSVVLEESDDPRGIDCGLIYREDLFQYGGHKLVEVSDLSGESYPLRGILHVWGKGPDGRKLHLFINHWKSRRGGVQETERLRMYAGIALRRQLDRLLSQESSPRVILMGDFNDEPTNRSLMEAVHAANKRKNIWIGDLYNLHYDMHNLEDRGTYNYQGTWQMYDQIIVSYSLLDQPSGLTTSYDGGRILREEWMMITDERHGDKVPLATYWGQTYKGGASDHLPVYVPFTY